MTCMLLVKFSGSKKEDEERLPMIAETIDSIQRRGVLATYLLRG